MQNGASVTECRWNPANFGNSIAESVSDWTPSIIACKLYNCYLLWRVLYLGDISEKNFYVANKITIAQCKMYLKTNMALLNIRMMPVFDTELPTYQLVCPDLLEIAMAQMFFECMNTDGYNIGVCTVCGSPFSKSRKNNTLCEDCQRTKYQRTRDKQRMVANIKKKSERTD